MEAAIQNQTFPGKSRTSYRPADYGLRNVLAAKFRREYSGQRKAIEAVAADYGLTYGEARGCWDGNASRATMDKVLKDGGWALYLEMGADLFSQRLEDWITEQAKREADDEARRQADARARSTCLDTVARRRIGDWRE